MKNNAFLRALSLIMSIAVVLTCIPLANAAEDKTFSIATVNDIHYYPECLTGNKKEAFYTYLTNHNCNYKDLDAVLDATLDSLAYEVKNNGVKHIVLVGDLTTNGEYEGHKALSEKLLAFEEKTGASIFVIPGNHDINNSRASEFVNDKKEAARKTTYKDFYEFYKDLGFSDAYHRYSDTVTETHGCLTYSVKTEDGYRLILADAGKFTADITESGKDEQETAGVFTESLLTWILDEAKDAKKNGETPLLFTHWNMSGMNYMHEFVMQGFVIDDWYMLQEILADNGINYTFSGHQHVSDVDITYSDSGNPMYSVITPTVTQFPFSYRVTEFNQNTAGGIDATFLQKSCDEYSGVKNLAGTGTYPSPYRQTGFYKQFGGHADASDYLFGILKSTLDKYVNGMRAEGSIVAYLEKELGFDIEKTIDSYLFGGIYLDGEKVISSENVMSFLNDIDRQLMDKYIYPKNETYNLIKDALEKLTSIQISEYPCTKFIDTYGFGDTTKGGTLGDAFLSILVYMYIGNEDISDDIFMQDVVEFSGTTEFLDLLIATIREVVVEDILINDLLSDIEIDLSTLFVGNAATVGDYIQLFYTLMLNIIGSGIFNASSLDEFRTALTKLLKTPDDISLKKLAETVLATGLISYGSDIDSLIDNLLEMFLPVKTREAIVYQAKIVISGMVIDDTKDWDVTYTNNGAKKVVPTKEDMQLPVNVTISMTNDNSTSFTVNWLTKYSVTGTDIEVVEKGGTFTGERESNAVYLTEETTYSAPGFDCGSFAILPYTLKANKHTVTVTGLKADTEYEFRIGDFEKGFASTGSIKTAPEKGGKFTFIHISDTNGLTPSHYSTFGDTLEAANKLYPDAAFTVHSGNLVSKPENDDQWTWSFTEAESTLTSMPFVYAAGTNDAENSSAVEKYFAVKNAPTQNKASGIYYSYDYSNAHFIVLNTNLKTSGGALSAEQASWLRTDLNNSTADWNILIMHENVFGSDTSTALHTQIVSIMNEYNIDLILQGNDTAYVRSEMLDGNTVMNSPEKTVTVDGISYKAYYDETGTVAIISGCTSHSIEAENKDYPLSYKTDNSALPIFSAITINGNLLTVNAYTVDGTAVDETDRFAVEKRTDRRLLGDIDNNGKITAADARLALRYSVELEQPDKKQALTADIDFNKIITASDARAILRASVGLETISPEYIFV